MIQCVTCNKYILHVFIFTLVFWDKGYQFFWLYALSGAILGASFVRNLLCFVFLNEPY